MFKKESNLLMKLGNLQIMLLHSHFTVEKQDMEGHFRSRKYVQNQSDESHGAVELEYRLVSSENRVLGG